MPGLNYTCPRCHANCSTIRQWKRHVRNWLCKVNSSQTHTDDRSVTDERSRLLLSESAVQDTLDQPVGHRSDVSDARTNVGVFLGKLHFIHNVPASVTAFVADEVGRIVKTAVEEASSLNHFRGSEVTETTTQQALQEFRSNHTLRKFCHDELPLTSSETIKLPTLPGEKEVTYQYVSILHQLTNLLNNCEHLIGFVRQSCAGSGRTLKDVLDGQLHGASDKQLRIGLYYDDFGVVDALGNKASKYKLGGLYFTILNVPKHLRSKVKSTFLTLLCKTQHLKRFGWDVLLKPLINDIKNLKVEGITVGYGDGSVKIKGDISCVVGDNLALNAIGGFTECFSSGLCCRSCDLSVDEQQRVFEEDKARLRTAEKHSTQLADLETREFPQREVAKYGVKARSAFCEIDPCFPVERLPPDVAHDLLEGVVPYVIALVVDGLIDKHFISLSVLNCRIESFDFQEANRPQPIKRVKSTVRVKQTAKESWILLRTLPLIIGDLVPEAECVWRVYLGLCSLVEAVLAPEFCEGDIIFLEDSVSNWLQDLTSVFPAFKLKPKFHFLVHYGTHIRRHGPLRNLWTMRYESKHSQLKTVAMKTKNRINLCKTITDRHQHGLAMQIRETDFMAPHEVKDFLSTRTRPVIVDPRLTRDISVRYEVGHAITYNHVKYRKGDVVLVPGASLSFAHIDALIMTETNEVFVAVSQRASIYDQHLNAYELTDAGSQSLLRVDDLLDHHPLRLYIVNGKKLVVP